MTKLYVQSNEQSDDTTLSARQRLILKEIVEGFIASAAPVGSRYISKSKGIGLSSATIRNVMADLEDLGYICQPHTSAGRVPTDKGYRYYVQDLMEASILDRSEKDRIDHVFENLYEEVDELLDKTSFVLANISRQLGIVLSPRFNKGRLERITLIKAASDKITVILTLFSGLVKTVVLEIRSDISEERLQLIAGILNERLHGLALHEIRESIVIRMRDVVLEDDVLMKTFVQSANRIFDEDVKTSVHYVGADNIIRQPEFSNVDRIKSFVHFLEEKSMILHLLDRKTHHDGITISIGRDHFEESIQNCSVITSKYQIGENVSGVVGIIGPTRMEYGKLIPMIEYISLMLNRYLNV